MKRLVTLSMLALIAAGTYITASNLGSLVWSLEVPPEDPRESAVLKGHSKGVFSLTFTPDGTRLLSGSDDHTIKVWDLKKVLNSIRFEDTPRA